MDSSGSGQRPVGVIVVLLPLEVSVRNLVTLLCFVTNHWHFYAVLHMDLHVQQ
jgi:hypothetical protein